MSEAARRHCAQLTREQAANFYYGMRLLGPRKRAALFAVYAFARRIDDIGDGTLPVERRARAARRTRRELLGSAAGRTISCSSRSPMRARASDCREQSLRDLIAGVRMDVDGATYATLRGAGRLLPSRRRLDRAALRGGVRLGEDPRAGGLADDLGVALQLTNILRDIREDAERGRTYLPAEDLERFGAPTPATDRARSSPSRPPARASGTRAASS